LNTPDCDAFEGDMVPGAPSADAPIVVRGNGSWLLAHLGGAFNGVYFSAGSIPVETRDGFAAFARDEIPLDVIVVLPNGVAVVDSPDGLPIIEDREGLIHQRFDARPGTFYLLRPDQHVCARWRRFDTESTRAAVRRATGVDNQRAPCPH
jgi:3-(3-hydroxy-phenyl)propionate hydroxylase